MGVLCLVYIGGIFGFENYFYKAEFKESEMLV
jgi:hypothetical protein